MTRFLALFLLAAITPVGAAGLPRNFSVTSFDRIRVEGPYAVTLATGRAPSARAEGSAASLDAIDLRVEGTTLILRQRSGSGWSGSATPVSIRLSTPSLRTALLVGAGSLAIDRMDGLSVDVAMQGSGVLSVGNVSADRINASAQGSGALRLAGRGKVGSYVGRGTATLHADQLAVDEVTLAADGAGDVALTAKSRATLNIAGPVTVKVLGNPACTVRASGSVAISGCRDSR